MGKNENTLFSEAELPKKKVEAKPFVKWAGGKTAILDTLESFLPKDFDKQENITYIEPFVGGGAMLFHMLRNHPNITRVVINDINQDLIDSYRIIKESPQKLIKELTKLRDSYLAIPTEEQRKELYLAHRDYYNSLPKTGKLSAKVRLERVCYFIFINHTCFNGLYRENKSGKFNVPWGRYKDPRIFDEDIIIADSGVLQNVEMLCGSYENALPKEIDGYTFVYFDPPYRPLSETSNFKDYNCCGFGDPDQEKLRDYCVELSSIGCKLMLSNSDSFKDGKSYFEDIFATKKKRFKLDRIIAPRFINAFAVKREKATEVLIRNY